MDEIISFAPGESVFAIGKKLRAGKFDLALVLPNSPRSALEVFLAGIPQRIGYARPWRNFFLTQAVAPRADAVKMRKRSGGRNPPTHCRQSESQNANNAHKPATVRHQIHEYLHLAAALGANPEPLAPQLSVTPEEIEAAKNKFGLDKIAAADFRPESRRGIRPGQTLAGGKIHRRRQGNPAAHKLRLDFFRRQK